MEAGEPRSDVLIGEMVDGRYRLVERIGEGATGLVYRAVAEPGSVAVAVKILRRDAAGGAARRFEREAVAAGKVAHENLVGVRDFGALDDGRPYLVMDLVEGHGLAEVIAESPLAPARALAILAHVLRGLREAHAAGVVHRDLEAGRHRAGRARRRPATSPSSSTSAPPRCWAAPAPRPSSSPAPASRWARRPTWPRSGSIRRPWWTGGPISTRPPASCSRC